MTITSPAPGATVCGTVQVTASAADDVGVVGVQFKYDGIDLGPENTVTPYLTYAYTANVPNGNYTLTAVARDAAGNRATSAPVPITVSNTTPFSSCRFIPTFLIYYGGGPALVPDDARRLAKFDLLDLDRWRFYEINPANSGWASNTWAAVRAFNPNVQIYLYEMATEASNFHDGVPQLYLNGLGRYDVSRGHPMGSLNGDLPGLFLLDGSGSRVYSIAHSSAPAGQYWYLMDFGAPLYPSYWLTAVQADLLAQPWAADGVFADNCVTTAHAGGYSATPAAYPTSADWSGAMHSFINVIADGLRASNQRLWCNRSETRSADGAAAWLALDASVRPPDVLLEEGAFAVAWGPWSVQFYAEAEWRRQADVMAAIRNSKVAMISHTQLMQDQSGTDNWGRPATFWQALWYSLGSFLLAKNDDLRNLHFMFSGGNGLSRIWWFDEYDRIDLGRAVGPYAVTAAGAANVYWREFERGYVYVNPSLTDVTALPLPQALRQLTHETLNSAPGDLPVVAQIALRSHEAAVLLKF